jgi:DNA-binding MarR family transcriptional regulator
MWGPEGGRPYGQARGRVGVGTIARDTVTATVGRDGVFTGATEAVLHLHRAANAVRQHVEQEVLRPKQLTWTGFVVLRTVWAARRIETRHVAEQAGISKATLTGVVDTLSGRGLMKRTNHPDDGRLVLLQLTRKGHRLIRELLPESQTAESYALSCLDAAELARITAALRGLVDHLDRSR